MFTATDNNRTSGVVAISPAPGKTDPETGTLISEIEAAADSQGLRQRGGWRINRYSPTQALTDYELREKKP